ncbi:T3SS effector EspW [Escherichia coli]|uniref:T3SS effector EspW n=1 Tax=Escherichia coli TaxID=562 RepID=A0A376ZY84_ECOLX|nr:T3SS effector EspW [Escherichia coli]
MFENISPDDTDKITGRKFSELGEYLYSGNVIKLSQLSIRYLPNINSISLIETKQSLLLHRLYSDEVLQRNGTLIPTPLHEEKSIPADNIKTMLNNIPTYKCYRHSQKHKVIVLLAQPRFYANQAPKKKIFLHVAPEIMGCIIT